MADAQADPISVSARGARRSEPALLSLRFLYRLCLGSGGPSCVAWVRLMHHYQRRGARGATAYCRAAIERKFACYIHPKSVIGPGVRFPHPVGIVIGERVAIGARVTIYQGVTIGAKSDRAPDYPRIDDDVVIYAGASVIGGVRLGQGCVIGANAVVLRDVPSGASAAGVPARVL